MGSKVVDIAGTPKAKPINFTLFENQWAKSYEDRTLTWGELTRMIERSGPYKTKGDAPWVKLAHFNGKTTSKKCYRHNDGVEFVTGVECDYDEGDISPAEAAEKLNDAELACFIYTSASHTKDAPRWRVLAPLGSPYTDDAEKMKAYRTTMIKRIENVLGIKFAPESHTLSQAYYYGKVEGAEFKTFDVMGSYVDERWDLDTFDEGNESPLEHYTRVDRSELVSDILTERAYHTSLRSLAAAFVSDGQEFGAIKLFLDAIMDAVPNKGPKWEDRKASIPGLIRTAIRKFGDTSEVTPVGFEGKPVSTEALSADISPFSFVVDEIMPASVMGITGAGGSMKSTMVLYSMIHIITGRTLFGKEVLKSGACVFVTAEDERAMVAYRVGRMCKALKLTEDEIKAVGAKLYIEDVSGKVARIVESKRDGNLAFSDTLDVLLNLYRGKGIVFLAFDPTTYFGAGERFVNDGESLLLAAGRKISAELGCATAFVHHVGKESGREKKIDQYSGRGGSAFADNSRAMWSMAGFDVGDTNVGAIPEDIQHLISEGSAISRLKITKMSYGKRIGETLWIGRDTVNAWEFHTYWTKAGDNKLTEKTQKEDADQRNFEIVGLIGAEITKQRDEGQHPNHRSLRSAEILHNGKKVSKQSISDLIHLGVTQGRIVELDLPEHLVQGARKRYLDWANGGPTPQNDPKDLL